MHNYSLRSLLSGLELQLVRSNFDTNSYNGTDFDSINFNTIQTSSLFHNVYHSTASNNIKNVVSS